MKNDLFNKKIKKRKTQLERRLAKYDQDSFDDRIKRLKYLQQIFPTGYSFLIPIETAYVFDEAKMTFINGEFISTIMLAQSFIEHRLQSYLASKGLSKESKRGLKYLISYLRKKKVLNQFLIDKIEKLRKIRNPFSHLRPEDESSISKRIFLKHKEPVMILEEDAKEAMSLMYQISITKQL